MAQQAQAHSPQAEGVVVVVVVVDPPQLYNLHARHKVVAFPDIHRPP